MKKLAVVLVLCGVGLLVYGILGFLAQPGFYNYASRIEAAFGAVLLTAGGLLWKWK
jgi:hypothetical protein